MNLSTVHKRPHSPDSSTTSSPSDCDRMSDGSCDNNDYEDDLHLESSASSTSSSSSHSCPTSGMVGDGLRGLAANIRSLPPHQRRYVTVALLLLAAVTAINVASMGFAVHDERREARLFRSSESEEGGGARRQAPVPVYSNVRATSSTGMHINEDPEFAERGPEAKAKFASSAPIVATDTVFKYRDEVGGEELLEEGDEEQVIQLMTEQNALIATMQQQMNKQQEIIKILHEEDPTPPSGTSTGPAAPSALELSGYKDTWEAADETDLPVFWHIPKTGGSTFKDLMGTCHRMTLATESGVTEGHDLDGEVAIVRIGGDPTKGQDPSPFVNVDTTTPKGLMRAKRLGFAQSGLADAMVTHFVFEANDIFDENHKGRLFSVFRHPVDRAVSTFAYLQYADWEPTYNPELSRMTLEEYAQSPYVENNWMTRYLSDQFEGDLTEENLRIAQDVVQRKLLVGLLSRREETMDRFERFFKWKFQINPMNQEICRRHLLSNGSNSNNNSNKLETPEPGSRVYDLLAWQNAFDIRLYEHIEEIFDRQEELVSDVSDTYRKDNAPCCKCTEPPECMCPYLYCIPKI